MKNTKHIPRRGFIALMSAVIISAILLMVAVTGSLGGFLARGNALNAELKKRSDAAADACADRAFLLLASSQSYTGVTSEALNNLDTCMVSISSNAAVTNLLISYSAASTSVLSWQEVPVY